VNGLRWPNDGPPGPRLAAEEMQATLQSTEEGSRIAFSACERMLHAHPSGSVRGGGDFLHGQRDLADMIGHRLAGFHGGA